MANFENNPKLKSIDPLKLKIITEIAKKSKNRSMEELLPQIVQINKEMNRRHLSFSKQESELLIESIEESLTPSEKARFQMLKGIMK